MLAPVRGVRSSRAGGRPCDRRRGRSRRAGPDDRRDRRPLDPPAGVGPRARERERRLPVPADVRRHPADDPGRRPRPLPHGDPARAGSSQRLPDLQHAARARLRGQVGGLRCVHDGVEPLRRPGPRGGALDDPRPSARRPAAHRDGAQPPRGEPDPAHGRRGPARRGPRRDVRHERPAGSRPVVGEAHQADADHPERTTRAAARGRARDRQPPLGRRVRAPAHRRPAQRRAAAAPQRRDRPDRGPARARRAAHPAPVGQVRGLRRGQLPVGAELALLPGPDPGRARSRSPACGSRASA